MRVVQKMKHEKKPVQEQKMRIRTDALCRSLLAVSEAGEAEPCGGGAAGLRTRTLVFIHDKSFFVYPIRYGVHKTGRVCGRKAGEA